MSRNFPAWSLSLKETVEFCLNSNCSSDEDDTPSHNEIVVRNFNSFDNSEDTQLFYEVAYSNISCPFEPTDDDLNLLTSSEVEKAHEDATKLFGDVQNLFDSNVDFNVNIVFFFAVCKILY